MKFDYRRKEIFNYVYLIISYLDDMLEDKDIDDEKYDILVNALLAIIKVV